MPGTWWVGTTPAPAPRPCADCSKDVSGGSYWVVPRAEGSVRLCNDCRAKAKS